MYYDESQMANIFGFSHMADKYRITYDSGKEDAFCVHMNHRILKFRRTDEGLYAYQPDRKFLAQVAKNKNMVPPPSKPKRTMKPTYSHHMGFAQTGTYTSDDDSDSDLDRVPGLSTRDGDTDDEDSCADDMPHLGHRYYGDSSDSSDDDDDDSVSTVDDYDDDDDDDGYGPFPGLSDDVLPIDNYALSPLCLVTLVSQSRIIASSLFPQA